MGHANISVFFEAGEEIRLQVQEYAHLGLIRFSVTVVASGRAQGLPVFHVDTADQVRAFVPAFVSKAEEAALDAEDDELVAPEAARA